MRAPLVLWLMFALMPLSTPAAQPGATELGAFQARLDRYAALHRRLERPLPPLQAVRDFGEVQRRRAGLREKIQLSRQKQGLEPLFTPGLVAVLRGRISSILTVQDIADTAEDVEEHTPPNMPPVSVDAPLPQDAPVGFIPPHLLEALPPLPTELRYIVLSRNLIVWDHHADLVVDIAPGLFDPLTYSKKGLAAPGR